jgi:phenylacetate-CoA ligase
MRFHDVCEATGGLRRALGFRGIQSSAEVLHDENKQRLRDLFGCGVFDLYGQREVGNIAQNARDAGPLLVNAESLVVETVPIDGAPHIVVTDLRNRSFPIIRYDTGDIAAGAAPDPGERRTLPLLGPVSGRNAELLRAPNGRLVHCEYFAHLFYSLDQVRQFQLVVGGDRLAIRYTADGEPDVSSLLEAIRRDIDPAWIVRLERVGGFDSLPSGKHCYVVREVHDG